VSFRETMQGFSEVDFLNADLKLLQDLCVCDFIKKNIFQGAKVLEIGGGNSRILSYFKDYFEGWNLDKFEGIGAGPIGVSETDEYIVVQNYIGYFDQRLPERYFDLVFSISVMEHINDNDSILSKIVQDIDRILKPGGYSVHCIDCRFPPSQNPSIDGRRLAKYIIQQYGLDPQFVLDEHKNPDVYYMSTKAYDLYWKKACNNRSHELDGLPFNIFLVKRKSDYNLKGIYGLATDT
jgi:SAM-dependent methyltransferase